jgi:hypothetical protein
MRKTFRATARTESLVAADAGPNPDSVCASCEGGIMVSMSRFKQFFVFAIALSTAVFAITSSVLAGTTGAIQGFVTDVDGRAIADAAVSAAAPSYATHTVTGPSGFYALNGLPLDTYTLTFSKTGYQPVIIPGVTTSQDSAARINAKLYNETRTLARVTVRGTTSLIQPTQTADTYVVNQTTLSNLNGTPQDPNGFQAFNSLPGVTTDNFGYPVIRAGAENDVGYQLDGVDNTDPVTGQFLNAVTLNGARSVQLSTGGYDVSNGNTNSGVINEVIDRGAYPGSGQSTARSFFSTFGHELSMDWGNASPDNKFSYYFSYDGQRDGVEYGDKRSLLPNNVAANDFFTTNDEVMNLFYHLGRDNKDEIQFLSNLSSQTFNFGFEVNPAIAPYASNNSNVIFGTENFVDDGGNDVGAIPQSDYFTLFPGQHLTNQNIGVADTQTFSSVIDKLQFKRQLTASSFADFRLFKTQENLIFRYPYDVGSFSDFYEDLDTQGKGVSFDYANQLSDKHEVGFGGDGTYYGNHYLAGFPSFENVAEPLEDLACLSPANVFPDPGGPFSAFGPSSAPNGGWGGCYIAPLNAAVNAYNGTPGNTPIGLAPLATDAGHAPLLSYVNDFSYTNDPVHRYDLWVKDRWQPNDRFTADLGLRFDQEVYGLPPNAAAANTSYYIAPDPANPNNPIVGTIAGAAIGKDVTAPSQVSPRLALSYELNTANTFRFSFGKNIEFVPSSAVENTYQIPASLANCNIANGCFVPLPGFGTFNHVSNLYQQVLLDLTTNNFAPYTPVRPQRAVNYDASWEHDFGGGNELRITPYYRKGTDYVVSSSQLLFTNRVTGLPVFGPPHESNAGVNENTGVELAFDSRRNVGLSASLALTYDNTFANYDSDFFPSVNAAALAANHLFHVSYVAPITATANLVWNSRHGTHVSATIPFESGYPYGVGKRVYIFQTNANGVSVPVSVLNTDVNNPNGASDAYYFTDSNTGAIIGSRGTPEGNDPGSIRAPSITTLDMTISQELGGSDRGYEIGLRGQNLLGNYRPDAPYNNFWYENCGFGVACGPNNAQGLPVSGTNLAAGGEPFQYNTCPQPYCADKSGTPREYTLFVSWKY